MKLIFVRFHSSSFLRFQRAIRFHSEGIQYISGFINILNHTFRSFTVNRTNEVRHVPSQNLDKQYGFWQLDKSSRFVYEFENMCHWLWSVDSLIEPKFTVGLMSCLRADNFSVPLAPMTQIRHVKYLRSKTRKNADKTPNLVKQR